MKQILKGAAISAIVLIVFIAINVICNINGINLDSISSGPVIAVCAMLIFRESTRNRENKEDQK